MQFEPVCRRCFGACSKTDSWKTKTIGPKVPTSARLQIFLIARGICTFTAVWNMEDALATQHVQGAPGNFFSNMMRENDNSESCCDDR